MAAGLLLFLKKKGNYAAANCLPKRRQVCRSSKPVVDAAKSNKTTCLCDFRNPDRKTCLCRLKRWLLSLMWLLFGKPATKKPLATSTSWRWQVSTLAAAQTQFKPAPCSYACKRHRFGFCVAVGGFFAHSLVSKSIAPCKRSNDDVSKMTWSKPGLAC